MRKLTCHYLCTGITDANDSIALSIVQRAGSTVSSAVSMSNIYLLTSLIDASSLSDNIILSGQYDNNTNTVENVESPTLYYLFDSNKLSNSNGIIKQKNLPNYLVSSQHYESFDAKLTYLCNTINTHTNKIQESSNTSINITSMVSDIHYIDAAAETIYSLLAREGSYLSPLKKNTNSNSNSNSKHDDSINTNDSMHFIHQSTLCSVILNKLSKFLSLKLDEQIALTGLYHHYYYHYYYHHHHYDYYYHYYFIIIIIIFVIIRFN